MTKLLFGCGYLGTRIVDRWRAADQPVAVVTRSARRAAELGRQGCAAIVADLTRPATLDRLPAAETVVFAVGYDRRGGPSIGEVYAGGVQNVLRALPDGVGRFVYISTTGVYGDARGGWVDERTPPDPQREGGRASLAAEAAVAGSRWAARGIVLRLAGIYGPGRVPLVDQLCRGEPIPAASEGHLNLIHVEDAASVVLAAEALPQPAASGQPRVYCVSDGQSVRRGDFYREAARQLGAAPPRFVAPQPGSPRAARAASDRRVSNRRMLAELAVGLKHVDYRAGLADILGARS